MPDLIQTANNLKEMPDQWLAQQAQSPNGMVPPWLVMAEIQRREKLRSGQSKAEAPQSSVAQDMIKSLFARLPPTQGGPPGMPPAGPGPNAPPGMPPVNLSGGSGGGLGPPAGTPPANLKMPRTMAAGGIYDDEDDDGSDLSYTPVLQRIPNAQQQVAGLFPSPATGSADRSAPDYETLIQEASNKYKLPAKLIRSVLSAESNGNPSAVSPKGAQGPMQLMPGTAKELGVTDPFDPQQSIDAGARYLKQLYLKYKGDQRLTVAAYNAGPGNVDKYGGVPPFKETQDYLGRVEKKIGADQPLVATSAVNTPNMPQSPQPQQPQPQPQGQGTTEQQQPPTNSPAAPVPQPIWKPPVPADLTEAKQREKEASSTVNELLTNFQRFDPTTLWTPDAINTAKQKIQSFLGPEPDNSRWTDALQSLQAQAQKLMHPGIGDMLMRFGLGLMASKQHNFGVAMGEAGMQTMQQVDEMQKQGSGLYLQALNMGMQLQERTNNYHQKVGQLTYEMQKGAQSAGEQSQRDQLAVIRDARTQVAAAHKDVAQAQTAYDKILNVPFSVQMQAEGALAQLKIPRDPALSPEDQLQRDAPQVWQQIFPTKAAASTLNHNSAIALTLSPNADDQKRGRDFLKAETDADVAKTTAHATAQQEVKDKEAQAEMPNAAKSVGDYIVPLREVMSRMPPGKRETLLGEVLKYNPQFQEWQYPLFQSTEQGFNKSEKRTDINNALYHVSQLHQAIDALHGGNVKLLNQLAQNAGAAVGPTAAQTFAAIANAVVPELTKVYVPGGGTKEDRAATMDFFKPSLPPEQLHRNLAERVGLLMSVAHTVQDQYKAGTYGRGQQHVLFDRQHQIARDVLHMKTPQEIQQYAASKNISPEQAKQLFESKGWTVEEPW